MSMEIASWILSGIATFSIVCIIALHIYKIIRPQFPICVNCWFCNRSIYVSYASHNSWNCPNCEQYNGFLRDGSYNKTIEAQYDSRLNTPVSTKKRQEPVKTSNGFCNKCNVNQELKIQQLAAFIPHDPARYDEEIDQYKEDLERAYKLCVVCELLLQRTLWKQKTWLLGLKFSQLRDGINLKKDELVGHWGSFTNLSSRLATVVLSGVLFLAACLRLVDPVSCIPLPTRIAHILPTLPECIEIPPSLNTMAIDVTGNEIYLTAAGFFLQLICVFGKYKRVDLVSAVLWLITSSQCWLDSEGLVYVTSHTFSIIHVCSFLTTLLSTIAAFLAHLKRNFRTGKRIEKFRIHHSKPYHPSHDTGLDSDTDVTLQEDAVSVRSRNSSTRTLRRGNTDETLSRNEKSNLTSSGADKKLNASTSNPPSDISAELNGIFSDVTRTSIKAVNPSSKFSPLRSASDISHMLNESMGNISLPTPAPEEGSNDGRNVREQSVGINRGIGNLKIGTKRYASESKSPPVSRYPDICKPVATDGVRRRPLLSPSRFELPPTPLHRSSVWDSSSGPLNETNMFAPLSRSSSQSSGFASQSSQPDITASQQDYKSDSFDGDDGDNMSQNPFYSTRSPRITPPQYAKSNVTVDSNRYTTNYHVNTPQHRKSPVNLYSQHDHIGFFKNAPYLNSPVDTGFYNKNLFSKSARDDDNASVCSQGFDYSYQGRPLPNVYVPQPIYLTPSLFMNGTSPYNMQFCFPQARSTALWDAATYALPRQQLALMNSEAADTCLPSGLSNKFHGNVLPPPGTIAMLRQHILTVLLVCGVLVNVAVYVGNTRVGSQFMDRVMTLLW